MSNLKQIIISFWTSWWYIDGVVWAFAYLTACVHLLCHHSYAYMHCFMYLTGKPRSRSSMHLIGHVVNQQTEVHFDVIANPVPHEYHVRLVRSRMNNGESTTDDAERSLMNITCKPSKMYRYLSICTLTMSKMSSQSNDSYKVQIINKIGDENFTVAISFGK